MWEFVLERIFSRVHCDSCFLFSPSQEKSAATVATSEAFAFSCGLEVQNELEGLWKVEVWENT